MDLDFNLKRNYSNINNNLNNNKKQKLNNDDLKNKKNNSFNKNEQNNICLKVSNLWTLCDSHHII